MQKHSAQSYEIRNMHAAHCGRDKERGWQLGRRSKPKVTLDKRDLGKSFPRISVSLAATAVGRHGGFLIGNMTDVGEIHFGSVSSVIKPLQVAIYTMSTQLYHPTHCYHLSRDLSPPHPSAVISVQSSRQFLSCLDVLFQAGIFACGVLSYHFGHAK